MKMKMKMCALLHRGVNRIAISFSLSLSLSLCARAKKQKSKKGANFFPSLSSKRNCKGERERERETFEREEREERRGISLSFVSFFLKVDV